MHGMEFDLNATTWLTAILLPLLSGLFWMIQGVKRELQARLEELARLKGDSLASLRAELAAHKLDVARGYAPLHAIRDIDRRLSMHLVRIEQKLERVAMAPVVTLRERDR